MALLLQYVIYILAEFVGIEREKYTENWMKRNFANNPRDRADVWKNEAKHYYSNEMYAHSKPIHNSKHKVKLFQCAFFGLPSTVLTMW